MGWNYHNKPPLGWPINWNSNLVKGLVGCWLMNEGGGQKVFDASGNGNTGTLTGTTWTADDRYGSALDFGGNPNRMLISSMSIPNETADITLIFYANPDTAGELSDGNWFYVNNTVLHWRSAQGLWWNRNYNDTDGVWRNSSDFGLIGNWKHLVMTQKGTGAPIIYIDGVQRFTLGQVTAPIGNIIPINGKTVYFGSNSSETRDWDGKFSFIRMYNRALTASEIAQLYREPFGMFKNPDEIPLLDQYYTVEEGTAGIMTLNTGYWGPIY